VDATASKVVKIEVSEEIANSLPDQKNEAVINIYPNPAINILNIEYHGSLGDNSKLVITDLFGKTVFTSEFKITGKNELNISHLPNGIYNLTLQTNTDFISKKIIKVR